MLIWSLRVRITLRKDYNMSNVSLRAYNSSAMAFRAKCPKSNLLLDISSREPGTDHQDFLQNLWRNSCSERVLLCRYRRSSAVGTTQPWWKETDSLTCNNKISLKEEELQLITIPRTLPNWNTTFIRSFGPYVNIEILEWGWTNVSRTSYTRYAAENEVTHYAMCKKNRWVRQTDSCSCL